MIHKILNDERKSTHSIIEEKLRLGKKTNTLCLTHLSLSSIPPEVYIYIYIYLIEYH